MSHGTSFLLSFMRQLLVVLLPGMLSLIPKISLALSSSNCFGQIMFHFFGFSHHKEQEMYLEAYNHNYSASRKLRSKPEKTIMLPPTTLTIDLMLFSFASFREDL